MNGMDLGDDEPVKSNGKKVDDIPDSEGSEMAQADEIIAEASKKPRKARAKKESSFDEDEYRYQHLISRDTDFENELLEQARPFEAKAADTLNINASSLGGCIRATYFARKGFPDERGDSVSKEQFFVFFLGHVIERGLAELLAHIRIDKGKARIRDYETGISGEVDRVVIETVNEKDEPIVIEIKTAWEYQYRRMYKDIVEKNHLNSSHYRQMQAYMMLEPRFKYGRYILLNKNMHIGDEDRSAFISAKVMPDPAEHARIREWVATLKSCVEKNIPPERPYSKTSWHCKRQYCPYLDVCFDGYEQEEDSDFEGSECID